MKKKMSKILLVLLTSIFVTGCSLDLKSDKPIENGMIQENVQLNDIPEFSNEPYTVLNGNVPLFTDEEITSTETFEEYSDLDGLGRCSVAFANLHQSIMPTEDRESIGMVKPSGWKTEKYDFVDGKYLYNRCHLIGFQLAGESKEIASSSENEPNDSEKRTFVVNKNSKKFHEEDCANANKISDKNREVIESDVNSLIEQGYEPAQCCVND